MLSNEKPCERFSTPGNVHTAAAHRDILNLSTSYRHDGPSYCQSEMWFPVEEAKEIVRILQEAIACTEEYQAAQSRGEGKNHAT